MHDLAKAARDREAIARQTRIDYQQKQLDNNAELAATVQKLMNNKEEKDYLDKAIAGLDITIKTLGKVKTIFLNAKVFWVGVKKHVESLAATQEELQDYAEDEDLREEYVAGAVESGYSWLTVGKICRMSALKIREVDKGVDEIMNDLPTEAEARVLIESIGAQIIADIADENKDIEKEIKSDHNKLPLPATIKLPVEDPTLPKYVRGPIRTDQFVSGYGTGGSQFKAGIQKNQVWCLYTCYRYKVKGKKSRVNGADYKAASGECYCNQGSTSVRKSSGWVTSKIVPIKG